jgi:hypothetical protein
MFKKFLIMKLVELKGFTKNEALSNAPFQVIYDATQAWKKAGKPITDKALKEFCAEYLSKKTKNASGIGCSITIENGTADTRERPYKVTDVKNEKGKRRYKTGIQAVDKETGEILFTNFENKTKAKELAKNLYIKEGYKGNIVARYVKEVVEGELFAFEVTYTPSVRANEGTYIAFGIEA